MSSWVTWTATLDSDWVSFTMISKLYFVLPIVMPALEDAGISDGANTYLSGPAKSASEPVCGDT